MLACSFVVAEPSVRFLRRLDVDEITFVVTGRHASRGDEDLACAEYLEQLLKGNSPDAKPYLQRVFDSIDAIQHLDLLDTAFPRSDLDYCTALDTFDFAMPITRRDEKLVMTCRKPDDLTPDAWYMTPGS
jgi:2-phosphosulfolactate phosphatase